jgi:hypothetical protein
MIHIVKDIVRLMSIDVFRIGIKKYFKYLTIYNIVIVDFNFILFAP